MDAIQLAAGTHIPAERAEHWAPLLNDAMDSYQINSPLRQAAFIAQTAHESACYTRLIENLNYTTAQAIQRVFGLKRFPTINSAQMFVRSPEALANFAYANRLGNGDASTEDGWCYRGRGLIQITGRENYTRGAAGTGKDLVNTPELLAYEDNAAIVSAWWWADNSLNKIADGGNIDQVTRVVNGPAMVGRDERAALFNDVLQVLL